MAKEIGKSKATIERMLKKSKIILHVGPKNGDHWGIVGSKKEDWNLINKFIHALLEKSGGVLFIVVSNRVFDPFESRGVIVSDKSSSFKNAWINRAGAGL